MDDALTLLDYARYIAWARNDYPTGIPRSALSIDPAAVSAVGGNCEELVAVYGPAQAELAFAAVSASGFGEDGFAGREGELFVAALTKGMKLKRHAILQIHISSSASATDLSVREQLSAVLERHAVKFLVCLGIDAAVLACGQAPTAIQRGIWVKVGEMDLIATHTLGKVLQDLSYKREFWEDLQAVKARLGGS